MRFLYVLCFGGHRHEHGEGCRRDTGDGYGFSGERAGAKLLLKIAYLGLTFGTCAEAVALVATFRRGELDAVCLGYLPTYLFQYLAGLLSSCH
ncbi:hypothetical protein, partial [uncultured Duncaniella sp.]